MCSGLREKKERGVKSDVEAGTVSEAAAQRLYDSKRELSKEVETSVEV